MPTHPHTPDIAADDPLAVDVNGAARRLGFVSEKTGLPQRASVMALIEDGELVAFRGRKRWMISTRSIAEYLAEGWTNAGHDGAHYAGLRDAA